jgi:hypothetical protein
MYRRFRSDHVDSERTRSAKALDASVPALKTEPARAVIERSFQLSQTIIRHRLSRKIEKRPFSGGSLEARDFK